VSTASVSSPSPKDPTNYSSSCGLFHFWLRRVHSLAGLMFGGYVVVHLTVNATGMISPRMYQENVDKIHSLQPMLPFIELMTIFAPLALHMFYGIYITKAGNRWNTVQYNYGGNVRYFLQRITAILLMLFLVYHIGTLHKWFAGAFNPENMAYQSTVSAIKTPYDSLALNYGVQLLYLIGILSAAFHFANGVWTSAIAWGLTVTEKSQKRFGHVCLGLGAFLAAVGLTAWVAFAIVGNPQLSIKDTMTKPDALLESH